MEQTPFLTYACCQQDPPAVSSLMYWQERWLYLQKWWSLTTHASYLSSDISRRDVAQRLWLALGVINVSFDVWAGVMGAPGSTDFNTNIAMLDTVLLGYLLVLRTQSTRHLLFDYRVAICWAMWCVLYRTQRPPSDDSEMAVIFTFLCTGTHATAQFIFVAITSISAFVVLQQWVIPVSTLVVGSLISYYSGILDYRSASLLLQLQHNTIAREKLLDLVTDGFCEVDIVSGIMVSSSPKFDLTVGEKGGLRGGVFSSLLHSTEDKGALNVLFKNAHTKDELHPILVTCRLLDGREFDAKLIPLSGDAGKIIICLQTLGEMRDGGEDCRRGPMKNLEIDEFIALAVDEIETQMSCVLGPAQNDLVDSESRTEVSGWSGSLDSLQYSVVSGESVRAPCQRMTPIPEHTAANRSVSAHASIKFEPGSLRAQPWSAASDCSPFDSMGFTTSSAQETRLWTMDKAVPTDIVAAEMLPPLCTQSVGIQTNTIASEAPPANILPRTRASTGEGSAGRPPRAPRSPQKSRRTARRQVVLNTKQRALHHFHTTPTATVKRIILDALLKINVEGIGCCFYHIALAGLMRGLKDLATKQCSPEWVPEPAWQCEQCLALNIAESETDDETDHTCLVCESDKPCVALAAPAESSSADMSSP